MGCAWETAAFILHALGAHDQQNVTFATIWQILFLLAPLWINAFVYMTFARIVHFYMPDRKVWIIKASQISKLFVFADFFSFVVQAAGGVMVSPSSSASVQQTGLHVYEGGIGIQELFIIVFLVLMITFHLRFKKVAEGRLLLPEEVDLDEENQGRRHDNFEDPNGCFWLLYALYAVLAFITVGVFPLKDFQDPQCANQRPCYLLRCVSFTD